MSKANPNNNRATPMKNPATGGLRPAPEIPLNPLGTAVAELERALQALAPGSEPWHFARTALVAARLALGCPRQAGGEAALRALAWQGGGKGLDPIVRLIGPGQALRLVEAYGGTRVFVPRAEHLGEAHPLARLLGLADALAVARAVGAALLKVPTCKAVFEEVRSAQMAYRHAHGETAAALAREFQMTEDSVYRLLARYREAHGSADAPPRDLLLLSASASIAIAWI